ncbi:GATOR2 complex protein WDR59 [Tribolium castaneum]|uniref:GATOR2 complex protein WDR59 n=1 Tax=Tribolium castaneum TaxID=7070 RepID=UPI0030FF3883
MAATWNNEYYIALEGRDLQANAMAVDNSGTYVLLAGRRYIAIRNLDEDLEVVQKFPRQSKYDVGAAEWNPTNHNRELCVISSNQRLEVLTWRSQELIQTHSLRAHTRVITDLNWHRSDPSLLASCSVDTFIHIWDLRDARRPSLSLSAIAEASQVRWNKISSHLLATAHDGDIKIWDQRKGTAPVQYVAAHLSKIHGLDWNPNVETQLATSSQDNTVKFFDMNNPRRAEYVLTTNAPVWRARFTPFGNGLVTVVVPQLRRGENSLLLWNTANRSTPMHTFVGHRDVVLEFEWRKQRAGSLDFQLITWSKDQTLLVWKIEPFLQKLCGHEPDEPREEIAISNESSEVVKIKKKTSPKIQPLQQEFSLLNVHIPNLEVTAMDPVNRTCTVFANVYNFSVYLQVSFPNAYPHGVPPTFQILHNSSVTEAAGAQLLQTLNHLAQQRVSKNRTCLESCLRQMVTTLEQLSADSENDRIFDNSYTEPNVFGGYNDAYIPFPRTSGAKFCSVGILVCFGRAPHTRRFSGKVEATTPRALSALETVFSKRSSDHVTVSAYYYQKQRLRVKQHSRNASKAIVHVYDVSGLLLTNRQLAEEYILDGDIATICKHNAASAAVVGRWDLVQAWTLAELIACTRNKDEEWYNHPFGNQLSEALISHYAQHSDIQMAAMLSCIFGKNEVNSSHQSKKSLKYTNDTSPYHAIPPMDLPSDEWVFPTLKHMRSTSLDNLRLNEIKNLLPKKNPSSSLHEYFKLSYAETLHRWGFLYNRAEVLKYMCGPPDKHEGVEFFTHCKNCLKPDLYGKHCTCSNCKKFSLNCIICHLSVRGSANCCIVCGHGGHTKHLKQWFEKRDVCPSGCGCRCLTETATIFAT